jgi:hypothetical protein
VYMRNSCLVEEPPDQIALSWKKVPRIGSGGRATISDANVRPYRDDAAAACDQNGRAVDHGHGYKAAPALGQGN